MLKTKYGLLFRPLLYSHAQPMGLVSRVSPAGLVVPECRWHSGTVVAK